MTKIVIEIKNCSHCPFFETRNHWSSDGWDRMKDWYCKRNEQTIEKSVEWHEKVPIPDWCPIKLKQNE